VRARSAFVPWFVSCGLALAGLAAGCKVDDKPPPATTGSQTAPAPAARDAAPPAPAVPVAQLVPDIPGAKLLQTRAHDAAQTYVRWCIDEPDAAKRVMDTLRREGWSDVATRGTGERIGVAATQGDVRFSATIGGRDDACAGTLVTATIARVGAIRIPPVEDRIR
jgi:hypothetical protein